MKHDEYHRQFADAIIEQIRQGTAHRGRSPGDRASVCSPRTSIRDAPTRAATACTWPPWPSHAATPTSAGEPTSRSQVPGRPGAERRAGHPDPLIPGPPEDRRQRRARPARQGQRRQARLPPRAPAHARRPVVHRLQRRAGRRAAGSADAHCRAALEGAPAGREGAGRQRSPRPPRGGRTGRSTT